MGHTADDWTVEGNLTVEGSTTTTGGITSAGTVQGADLIATDDCTVGDDLAVSGKATVGETLAVTGAITGPSCTCTATVQGADLVATDDCTVGDDLAVTGLATVGETLAVVDTVTIGDVSGALSLDHDGTDANLITDIVAASDLVVDCGTAKTIELVTPVWDDLRVPLTSGRIGATNPPTFAQFKDDGAGSVGVYAWSFADEAVGGNEEQLWFAVQLPHSYKHGTDICPHIHWTPAVSGGAGEYVKWGLEYSIANIGDAFATAVIVTSDASAAGTATSSGDSSLTAGKHYLTVFADISGAAIDDVSSMLVCRLFRNSSHATDDLAQAAFAFEFDFHYQIDTMGSRAEVTK